MALTPEQTARLSQADLEKRYLESLGADPLGTLTDARNYIYGLNEFPYFAALSGLIPTTSYSLSDHKLAYYRTQTATPNLSLSDTARLFWASQIP